jgi:hypothetical protein
VASIAATTSSDGVFVELRKMFVALCGDAIVPPSWVALDIELNAPGESDDVKLFSLVSYIKNDIEDEAVEEVQWRR